MIEARELRIGNYYDHNGEIKRVNPNTIQDVWEVKRSWCKGIPLTPEWLEKFGFEAREPYSWRGNGYDYQTGSKTTYKDFIRQVGGSTLFCRYEYFEGSAWTDPDEYLSVHYGTYYPRAEERVPMNMEVKWIHQLQNLYFALTGTELTEENER